MQPAVWRPSEGCGSVSQAKYCRRYVRSDRVRQSHAALFTIENNNVREGAQQHGKAPGDPRIIIRGTQWGASASRERAESCTQKAPLLLNMWANVLGEASHAEL